jgi:hypothetical protein
MASPAGAFRTAVEAALRASSDLLTAMGTRRLYTEVPANAVLPYVVIGQDQILLQNGECADEAEVYATVHCWSRTSTPDHGVQARNILDAVIAALNTDLTVTGWDVVEWGLQSEVYSTDPDGSTHGRVELRYLLTEITA